jgi:hypothetical protein
VSIAELFNVPQTPEQMMTWSFANAAAHVDINRLIFQNFNTIIPSYVLDPVNPNDMQQWLYQHQLMHQDMDAVLGIAGYDLLDVDWRDPGQFAGWIEDHANEHVQAGAILGLG